MRLRKTSALAFALLLSTSTATALADSSDPIGSIYAAASNHSVSPGPMLRVAFCESRFNPSARGDGGGSYGLYQLNGTPTGLLGHFYSLDYDDPFDAEQSADYYARVYAGEFLPGMPNQPPLHPYGIVSVERWSCK